LGKYLRQLLVTLIDKKGQDEITETHPSFVDELMQMEMEVEIEEGPYIITNSH